MALKMGDAASAVSEYEEALHLHRCGRGLGLGSAEPAEPATCSSAAEPALTLTS